MSKHDRHGQHIYGTVHQKKRKRWIRRVRAGGVVCWRCGDPIGPSSPSPTVSRASARFA